MTNHVRTPMVTRQPWRACSCWHPVTLLLPVAVWSCFVACHEAVGNIANGNPKWFASSFVQAFSWPGWYGVLLVLLMMSVALGMIRLREMRPLLVNREGCGRCGYSFHGLRECRCPECGWIAGR